MAKVLDGKVALIIGDAGAAGAAIAAGLAEAGAAVGTVASPQAKLDDRTAVEQAVDAVAGKLGAIDIVVLPVVDPAGLSPAPFAELSEAEWLRRCETPLRGVRVALQAAHKALKDRGGRMLLLVPTIAITGAEGLAPYTAVAEGARSLAKAAARRWGALGITVNCLALLPEQLHPGVQRDSAAPRVPNALGHVPDLETEIAPFIAMLATAPGIVTGTTLMVDGGNLMSI
jgi:3-oxoacyl-[acyl-carrier protein] reductase